MLTEDFMQNRSQIHHQIGNVCQNRSSTNQKKSCDENDDRLNRISISPQRNRDRREQDKKTNVAMSLLEKSADILGISKG